MISNQSKSRVSNVSSGQKAGLWFENYCEIYCWYQITSQMLLKFRMLVHNIASGSKICIKCVQCMHWNRKIIKTSDPVSITAAKFYQHTVHLSYQTMVLEITKCIFDRKSWNGILHFCNLTKWPFSVIFPLGHLPQQTKLVVCLKGFDFTSFGEKIIFWW